MAGVVTLDQECLALYRLARACWVRGDEAGALALHRRIRAEHSVELWPGVELPEHVVAVHPVASVLGRADYGDYLVFYQNCGVGSDVDGNRPTLGRGVCLFPGARILGAAEIGDNVFICAGTILSGVPRRHVKIPSNVCVFPASNKFGYDFKPTKRSVVSQFWKE